MTCLPQETLLQHLDLDIYEFSDGINLFFSSITAPSILLPSFIFQIELQQRLVAVFAASASITINK